MPNFSGASQGYLDFTQQQQQRQQQQAQVSQMLQSMARQKWEQDQKQQAIDRSMEARRAAGGVLYGQLAQPPEPGASSPGGTPNGAPPQPQAPGGNASGGMSPPPQMGGPQMSPAPQQPQPWQPMPKAPPGGAAAPAAAGGMPPQLQPPPAPPQAGATPTAQPGADGGVVPQRQFDLKSIIGTLKAQGVPPDKVMDMLDEMAPVMNAQNKQELEMYKAHNSALLAATRAYQGEITALARTRDAETRAGELDRKRKDDESKDKARKDLNEFRKKKLESQLGKGGGSGSVKIVRWTQDEDGVVTGGYDRAGHFHEVDKTQETGPKAGANKNRTISQLKEDRRSLIARGISDKDKRIKELDAEITKMERGGRGSGSGAAQAPAGEKKKYAKNDVIDVPGRGKYTVVGFDKDGEPLVEPVK